MHRHLQGNKTSHRGNPAGLGRWTSVRFKGKQGYSLTVISAYRPCHSANTPGTVWSQHIRYFADGIPADGIRPDPHEKFDTNLLTAVDAALEEGNEIIPGIDHNEDARTSYLSGQLGRRGLRNPTLTLHGANNCPATQARNHDRKPIDALWVSVGVEVCRSGFCAFDDPCAVESDHRLLWVEVDTPSILGKASPPPQRIRADRLKFKDPRLVKRCTREVHDA